MSRRPRSWMRAGRCLLIVLFVIAGVPPPSAGQQQPPDAEPQTPQQPAVTQEPLPPRTGYVPLPLDLSHLTGCLQPGGTAPELLPRKFDWRDSGVVTGVRDQGHCSSCYAFAAIGALESMLWIVEDTEYDLSENHAKECCWRELNDWEYPPGNPHGSCDGGNQFEMASLFSQKGTVLESCDPYQPVDVGCKATCPYQQTVLDWRLISWDTVPSTMVLKQYLYDHGPLMTTMYANAAFDEYDGSSTIAYAAPPGSPNHCVLIVGWSDELPPVPGGSEPAQGWIVKNSYGTGWGDEGYFYIAYGAANIGTNASYYHEVQNYDPGGDIWHYDDDTYWEPYGYNNLTAWGLARFIPDRNTYVTRVEFWTVDITTDVDVYLYDWFNGAALGTLLAEEVNSSFSEAGYHSVALDRPLAVTAGDDVIAVVKFTNESYGWPVPTDPHGTVEIGRTYLSRDGATWTDMGVSHHTDVAIRLRTSTGQSRIAVYLPLVLKGLANARNTRLAPDGPSRR